MSEKLPLRSCLSLTAGTDDDGRIFCVMLVLTLLWHQCLLLHLIMVILTCPLISPLMPSVCGTYSNKNSTLGWKTSGNILLETTPASKPIKVGQLVVKLGYFLIHFFCWPALPQQHSTAIYSDLIRTPVCTVLTDDSYMQDCIQLQHCSSFNGWQVSFH